MGFWLRALSIAFVVSGASFGTVVLLQGQNGERLSAEATRLRPAIDDLVGQGSAALSTLIGTTRAATMADSAKPAGLRGARTGDLPFVVIEPRDFAAPAMQMPSVPAPRIETDALSDLRLTQSTSADQSPLDLNPVEARLRARVPQDVLQYFDLFLYVSKATPDKGTWAQRMFVLAKQQGHTYELVHNWPVSTGMEEMVVSPSGKKLGTHTPEGVFKLDRDRAFAEYTSRQWKSPMPYAIFFDWRIEGRTSGLAIHGSDAKGELSLGNRASHGCIRLATDNARTLFEMITQNHKGRVPVFRIDPNTETMSTKGALVRDENGKVKMTRGFKVLVFIEDYGGPSVDTVAALF